eukprot:SAG31_NODE_5172_length_2700_cov_4.400231_4_plen_47_part_01
MRMIRSTRLRYLETKFSMSYGLLSGTCTGLRSVLRVRAQRPAAMPRA